MVERNGNGYKSLENWIWDAACSIRGAQEAAKYKDFILPLIFTKRLCDVFASYLIRLRTNKEKLNSFFLNHYFNWDKTQIRLKGIATRAVSQSNISASRLKGFIIPLPKKLEEQDEIVKNLDYCDYKIAVQRQKCNILNDLFRTLLHQLMTAQIRVDDLNISALNLEPQGGNE